MSTEKLINYYQSLTGEPQELQIFLSLLDKSSVKFNSGQTQLSKLITQHVPERDIKRLLKDILPILINNNAFSTEEGEYLYPSECLSVISICLYLETFYEEFKLKSGRKGFFMANYRNIRPEWVYFAYEFLLSKTNKIFPRDLLALSIGIKKYDLNIISKWSLEKRIKIYLILTRKQKVGIFKNETFVDFLNVKRINEIEEIINLLFQEIDQLINYFTDKTGHYFEMYGIIEGIKSLTPEMLKPKVKKEEEVKSEKTKPNIKLPTKKTLTPLEKNLALLKLTELPSTQKELKKVFYRLALEYHPDKFAHIKKGTRTELEIMDKFRTILNAYEYVDKELKNK